MWEPNPFFTYAYSSLIGTILGFMLVIFIFIVTGLFKIVWAILVFLIKQLFKILKKLWIQIRKNKQAKKNGKNPSPSRG